MSAPVPAALPGQTVRFSYKDAESARPERIDPMRIEQAIYGEDETGSGPRFLARSSGFQEDWLPLVERLCADFGSRPAGVACPLAVFALLLDAGHVAVVQVADQPGQGSGLLFRVLVLSRRLYADLGGDPFHLADQFPPPWKERGDLPTLESAEPAPYRTIDQLRRVLDVPHSPTLLGGVQVLIEGGKLVFERSEPDSALLRSLWALLPLASRAELWPATFAFSNAHRFHALVIPRARGPEFEGYVNETQAGDYPEGNYEHALQTAIEDGDQREVDALFARRTRGQMIRLGLILLVIFAVASLFLARPPSPPPTSKPAAKVQGEKP